MRPYFVHIRNKTNDSIQVKGGTTVAIVGDPDNGYKAGIAKCSLKDNYCKSIGRQLATGRAFEKRTQMNLPDDITTMRDAESYVRQLFQA
ncbi:MAG TPA: hypothetical protein VFM18_15200 [Methanosarcina sp.]|nr:hypothetical protein [Methanosarcina sp.]